MDSAPMTEVASAESGHLCAELQGRGDRTHRGPDSPRPRRAAFDEPFWP